MPLSKKLTLSIVGALAVGASLPAIVLSAPKNSNNTPKWQKNYSSIVDAIKNGKAGLKFRFRNENVDQDGFDRDAHAFTLRSELSYQTAKFHQVSAFAALNNVTYLANQMFDNLVAPRKTQYPVVADPDETQVNQAYFAYSGVPHLYVQAGRQNIVLDDSRFIGNVGYRQTPQTFDGGLLKVKDLVPHTEFFAGYISKILTILNKNIRSQTKLFNLRYTGFKPLTIIPFYYSIGEMGAAGAYAANSSNTYGLRLTGKTPINNAFTALYEGTYARQSDAYSNPNDYSTYYYNLMAGLKAYGATVKLNREVLASDKGVSFRTPLATGHKFQGWTDQFLTTPANGMIDNNASLGYKIKQLGNTLVYARYHDFKSTRTSQDYGHEWDFKVGKNFMKYYNLNATFADFKADTGSGYTDTREFVLEASAKFL